MGKQRELMGGPLNFLISYYLSSNIHLNLYFVLVSGFVPSIWNKDLKTPLIKASKSGERVEHLRPITLLPILLKGFERWCNHLTKCQYVPHEAQGGFRKGYKCIQRVFILLTIVQKQLLLNRASLWACFVDFSQFFDSVRHECVAHQMAKRQIREYLIKAFLAMYEQSGAFVMLKGKT